ncbi:MAG: hypothetical protein OK454_12015, partial [Thaumarchaeota archaeon]|nr:hypothetical protein [Nitrososphaerota archaeon]
KHCADGAKRRGIDLPGSRKLVRDIIETSFGLPASVLRSTPFSETLRTSYVLSTDLEQLRDIQGFQRETVSDVFSEARETIRDSGSKTKLNVITYGGFSGEHVFGRGAEGVSLPKLAGIVDGIDLVVYVSEPEVVHYLVKWCAFEARGCPIYAAFRPAYPVLFSREGVVDSVRNAFEAGASGVAFYNYGWTPLRNFEWIKDSLKG